MIFYTGVVTIIFMLLTIIWSTKNRSNFTIKFIFFYMTLWSCFNFLNTLGYLVKVGG